MNNIYRTNGLTCKAVQFKDANDIESFNNEVRETLGIDIDNLEIYNVTSNPILVVSIIKDYIEKPLFLNEGDYFVDIPSFKRPINMHKELFESLFEKVED